MASTQADYDPATDLNPVFEEAGKQYNIDPDYLRAKVQVESGGNPNAVSPQNAQGIAQFIPPTAKAVGLKDPFDPWESIYAMAKLDRENMDRYNDPTLATAAYHGGTDPAHWGPKTQAYVNMVTDTYSRIKAAKAQQQPPVSFDDLIPKDQEQQPSLSFDDLIPKQGPMVKSPGGAGKYDSSLPVAKTDAEAPIAPNHPAGVEPLQPEPQDTGWIDSVYQGLKSGIRGGAQTYQALTGGKPTSSEPTIAAAQPMQWGDVSNPGLLGRKMLYGLAASAPQIAGFSAGSVLAGGPETPLGLVGGAIGAAIAGAATTLGPAFGEELKANPQDPDGAFNRALKTTGVESAFTGIGFGAFGVAPFEGALKNLVFQAFGMQPAVAVAQKAASNVVQGQPIGEGLMEPVPGAIAMTAAPMLAHMGAGAAARRLFPGQPAPAAGAPEAPAGVAEPEAPPPPPAAPGTSLENAALAELDPETHEAAAEAHADLAKIAAEEGVHVPKMPTLEKMAGEARERNAKVEPGEDGVPTVEVTPHPPEIDFTDLIPDERRPIQEREAPAETATVAEEPPSQTPVPAEPPRAEPPPVPTVTPEPAPVEPKPPEAAAPEEAPAEKQTRGQTPFARLPKEPQRLVDFLRRPTVQFPGTAQERVIPGGVRDPSGDLKAIIGGTKGRPGLVNNKTGSSFNDAMLRAWEAGYFPEHGETAPDDDRFLLEKIAQDHNGQPVYSSHDQDAADAYHEAMGRNDEIDRLADQHGIPTAGLTREQFFDQLHDRMSVEERAQEIESQVAALRDAHADAEAAGKAWFAYHGTPHEFDRFDTSKIGTGEGAQAYGHGLYYAENPEVAGSYRDALSSTQDAAKDARTLLASSNGDFNSAINANKAMWKDPSGNHAKQVESILQNWKQNGVDAPLPAGHLLQVRLHAKPEEMLDWDKPLSEQPPKVREALEEAYPGLASGENGTKTIQGAFPYGVNTAVSRALHEAGIKGIRYLDQQSRNASGWHITPPDQTVSGDWMVKSNDYNSKGLHFKTEAEAQAALAEKTAGATHNVVMFDHNDVEITHRNGKPVAPEAWNAQHFYGQSQARTLEDLEREHRSEMASPEAQQRAPGDAQPGPTTGDQGEVQAGEGPRGDGAGADGRGEAAEAPAAAPVVPSGRVAEHTTKRGKLLRGVIRDDISFAEAKALDPYTFKKDGGWFIREAQAAAEAKGEPAPKVEAAATPKAAVEDVADAERRDLVQRQAQAAKLRSQAGTARSAAQESMGKDRQTNTRRRAGVAASAEADARKLEQLANTMSNLADAIENGEASHLSGITSRAQVEELDRALRHAQYTRVRTMPGVNWEKMSSEPPTTEDLQYARLSAGSFHSAQAKDIAAALKGKKGFARLVQWLEGRSIGDTTIRPDPEQRAMLEKAVKALPNDYAAKRVKEALAERARFTRMGITDDASLQRALGEFLNVRGERRQEDPIKRAERDLIGQNVGKDFFPTPAALVENLVREADVQPGMRVLEPSAGKGDIADALRDAGAHVDTVELSSTLRELLKAKGHTIAGDDFEKFAPAEPYDRVVMNPPFSDRLDAAHVQRAYDMLKPGGRLVAIMGEGTFFGTDAKARQFREWMEEHDGASTKLPDGSFKSSFRPTGVATRMVVVDKPGPVTVPAGADARFARAPLPPARGAPLLGEAAPPERAKAEPEPTIRNDPRQELMPGMGPSAVQAQAARDQTGRGGLEPKAPQAKADEGLFAPKEPEQDALFQKGWDEIEPGEGAELPSREAVQAAADAVADMLGGKGEVLVHMNGLSIQTPEGERSVDAMALGRVIHAAYQPRTLWNLDHEVVHALRNMGLFTEQEWKTLEATARRANWVQKFGVDQRWADLRGYPEKQLEEAIAEAFAAAPRMAPGSRLHQMAVRIGQFFDRLRNALMGRGFQSADDVFAKARSGEVGAREPGSGTPERLSAASQEARAPTTLNVTTPQKATEILRDKKGIDRAVSEIKAALAPTSLRGAKPMEGAIRRHTGESAQAYDIAYHELQKVRDATDALSKQEQVDFTDRMETGQQQPTPELQRVADALRQTLDTWKAKVQGLGRGYLANSIDNYMGHIWGNYHEWSQGLPSNTPQSQMQNKAIAGNVRKQPLQGSGNFLKRRYFPTQKEGIDAGLIPVTTNPVDLQMIKVHEMQKFYHGITLADRMKADHLAQWVPQADQHEAERSGMVKLDDRIFQPKLYGVTPIGPVEPGAWYSPEPAARVFNNYMSQGWHGQSSIYDGIRRGNNALNTLQLGFSGFHAAFVSADTAISKVALGIQQIAQGHGIRGAGNILFGTAGAPAAIFSTVRKGAEMRRAWLDPSTATPEMRQIVDAFKGAGGRISMPEFFQTSASGTFFKTLSDMKNPASVFRQAAQMFQDAPTMYQKAVMTPLRIAGRVLDTINQPLMGALVPRAKMGVFADMASNWLRDHPTATAEEVSAQMTKFQDSVDNRLGQLNYDNLFWAKTAKDIAFITTRSVGWNLGTLREIGGAFVDSGSAIKAMASLKAPQLTTRMAYTIALPVVTAEIGAILTYLATGAAPTSKLDYFYPPTGEPDENGQVDRRSIPGYMKDVIAFWNDPLQTVLNKTAPLIEGVQELVKNRDYYGGIIYDPERDAGPAQAYGDFMLNQTTPFSLRAFNKLHGEGAPAIDQSLGFWGFQPAPKSITQPERGEKFREREQKRAFRAREKEYGRGMAVHVFNTPTGAAP